MQTHPYATPVTGARRRRAAQPEGVNAPLAQGGISEVVYIEDQPVVGHILLPLLRQLGLQSRWLLWLTSSRRLSRPWLAQSGLPLQKVVQLRQPSAFDTVAAMEKPCSPAISASFWGGFPLSCRKRTSVVCRMPPSKAELSVSSCIRKTARIVILDSFQG
ncbi:Cell division inhibitor SulA [Sodalis praecaptivus]